MKKIISYVCLSVCGVLQAQANDFGLATVDQSKVNKKKWHCKYCVKPEKLSGDWTIMATYLTNDEAVFRNVKGGEFMVAYRDEEQYADLWFTGLDGNYLNPELNLGAKVGFYSGAKFSLNYQESARLYGDSGQSPFHRQAGATLVLPENWLANENSQQMPNLIESLSPVDLELLREKLSLAFEYRSQSPWQPRLSFTQENKQGTALQNGFSNYHVTMLPAPVSYTTNQVDSGVSYQATNWLTDFSYQYSEFRNDHSVLTWQDPFSLNTERNSLSPDNKLHRIALQGRYRQAKTQLYSSANFSRSVQDQLFIEPGFSVPVSSLDGQIDQLDFKLKLNHNYNRKSRFSAKISFNERNNKTVQYLFADRYNRVNDYRKAKIDILGRFKEFELANIRLGAHLTRKTRPQQERKRVDEQSFSLSVKDKKLTWLDLKFDYLYSERDGSAFKRNEQSRNPQNERLRRFNLADRKRHQYKAWLGYSVTPLINADLNVFYADDDYDRTEVGLTDATDKGYELTLTGVTGVMDWQLYYSNQKNSYDRAGSDNQGAANWWGATDTDTDQFGFSLDMPQLIEHVLAMSINYHFTRGAVEEKVSQHRSEDYSDYPDSRYEQHRIDWNLNYVLSQKSKLNGQLIYERNNDVDYFYHNADVDTLSNLVSAGIIGNNYNTIFFGLSYQREF